MIHTEIVILILILIPAFPSIMIYIPMLFFTNTLFWFWFCLQTHMIDRLDLHSDSHSLFHKHIFDSDSDSVHKHTWFWFSFYKRTSDYDSLSDSDSNVLKHTQLWFTFQILFFHKTRIVILILILAFMKHTPLWFTFRCPFSPTHDSDSDSRSDSNSVYTHTWFWFTFWFWFSFSQTYFWFWFTFWFWF